MSRWEQVTQRVTREEAEQIKAEARSANAARKRASTVIPMPRKDPAVVKAEIQRRLGPKRPAPSSGSRATPARATSATTARIEHRSVPLVYRRPGEA